MLAFVALVHAPAQETGFVWDDHVLAERDAPFRHSSIPELFVGRFWPETTLADPRTPYYRPMVLLSLRFDAALGGDAAQHHQTNIVLHLTACALLVVAAVRVGAKTSAAILAALVWGVAPRLTESVTWIAGRTDLLAMVFGLAAIVSATDNARTPRAWIRGIATGLLVLGSLFSKEIGLAFALGIAVLVCGRDSPRTERARELAVAVAAPLAVYFALRTIALSGHVNSPRELGAAVRAATVLEALARYAEMTVDALHPQTSIGYLGEVDAKRAMVGAVLAFGASTLVLGWRKHLRQKSAGVVVVGVLALLMVIHIVPLALSGAVASDRLLYAPLAALAIGSASWGSRLGTLASRAAAMTALLLAVVFGGSTKTRIHDYRDEVLFWTIAAEKAHPHNTMPRSALAGIVRDAEHPELACRLYEKSLKILETSGRAESRAHQRTGENLGACWARIGRYDDAVALAEDVARAHPDVGRVQMGLGFARLHVRNFEGATTAFSRAIALDRTLSRLVSPVLASIPHVQSDARLYSNLAARADKLGWAKHLADLGRATDADEAFLDVLNDGSVEPALQRSAITYLALDGSLQAAEAALPHTSADIQRAVIGERLEQRHKRRERVEALRERIEALAR